MDLSTSIKNCIDDGMSVRQMIEKLRRTRDTINRVIDNDIPKEYREKVRANARKNQRTGAAAFCFHLGNRDKFPHKDSRLTYS